MNKRLVCGVGIMDADYRVEEKITIGYENGKRKQKRLWICPFYRKWRNMLVRCYYEKELQKHPTYKGCSVCQEWLTFSNFKAWMEKQDWEGKSLDKDILYPGNKVYSPETCIFVDQKINSFLVESDAVRGEYMIGVYWHKRDEKFLSRCSDGNGKQRQLGSFDTELDAHNAWLEFKLKLAKQLASEQTDPRIAKALVERYENYKINDKQEGKMK